MPYIRHESLFSLQDLYHMEREQRFEVIFATIDLNPALSIVNKRSRFGAPVDVNYHIGNVTMFLSSVGNVIKFSSLCFDKNLIT